MESETDAELGSSEETLEAVSNVSTKSFSGIASLQLVDQKVLCNWHGRKYIYITKMCLLQDGHLVTVSRVSENETTSREGPWFLKIQDSHMRTKVEFDIKGHFFNTGIKPTSLDIAVFDTTRVACAMTGYLKVQETSVGEPLSSIHLIKVSPSVEITPEIKLQYVCEKITCFNNRIYCYSPDLRRSSFVACPGIEILAMNGEVLKTIQLFDTVSSFCPTKDGGIIYFGSRKLEGNIYTNIVRCVTQENVEVFNNFNLNDLPQFVISDVNGNLITFDSSAANMMLLNSNGTLNRALLAYNDIEVTDENLRHFGLMTKDAILKQHMSCCFCDDYDGLLVVCFLQHGQKRILKKYKYNVRYTK